MISFFFSQFHQRADDEALTRLLKTSLFLVASPILVKSICFSFRSSLNLSIHQRIWSVVLWNCIDRGVQYVHWGMHKCIMVKVGGKRNTCKLCKKQVNLSKTEGKFVKAVGKIIIFAKQRGNVLKHGKQGGNSKFVSSEILADENREIFREKVKL